MAVQQLIIVGASARAAAFSTIRAGMHPWCADLFADADLRAACPVTGIDSRSYPNGFERILRGAPDAPWIYTGGLENHPKLIARLASIRPLWGNCEEVLRAVRDPLRLMQALRKANVPVPECRFRPPKAASPGIWLQKPLAGAGGAKIQCWPPESPGKSHRCYYQEFISGISASAVYAGIGGQSYFLGATRQLIGEPWLMAKPFHYCGSIGPLDLSRDVRQGFERIGDLMVAAFRLRGLFGIDAVIRDDVPYLVEVNPRYTASMEVLELASQLQVINCQRQAFDKSFSAHGIHVRPERVVGKAIVFAPTPLLFPIDGPWLAPGSGFADIPMGGTRIEAGWPVMTFLTDGLTPKDVLERMQNRMRDVRDVLFRAGERCRERET
jgi:uncharacterized protein